MKTQEFEDPLKQYYLKKLKSEDPDKIKPLLLVQNRNNVIKWKQNAIKEIKINMLETITCEFMILVVLRFFRLTGDCATVQIFFSLRTSYNWFFIYFKHCC